MALTWDSPEFWAAMKWDHAVVDKNGWVFSYLTEPTKGSDDWNVASNSYYDLGALDLVGVPKDWEESRISRPIFWQVQTADTEIDTSCFVRQSTKQPWELAHTAGGIAAWPDGRTSHTANDAKAYHQIVLADPNAPQTPPPLDFVPGLET